METGRKGNALKDEIVVRVEEAIAAPAAVVYDPLADVRSHLDWAPDAEEEDVPARLDPGPRGPRRRWERSSRAREPTGWGRSTTRAS
jgi:hypothetical protein